MGMQKYQKQQSQREKKYMPITLRYLLDEEFCKRSVVQMFIFIFIHFSGRSCNFVKATTKQQFLLFIERRVHDM